MGKVEEHSATSSIDSSEDPSNTMNTAAAAATGGYSYNYYSKDLSTDLRLGLTISSSQNDNSSTTTSPRELQYYPDWPPIKPSLKSTLAGSNVSGRRCRRDHHHEEAAETSTIPSSLSMFVKVYMEGIPIGRKLDLLSLHGYDSLVTTLSHMFRATILCPDGDHQRFFNNYYILTYEDKEGDWMMVGDVPWEYVHYY